MQFNSWLFIGIFLPISLIAYYALNKYFGKKAALASLLISSFIFYAYASLAYFCYFIICCILNYELVLLINKTHSKYVLAISIILNIGALGYLKYSNFFLETMNHIIGTDFNMIHLFAPLGLSYFTFQFIALSYDIYIGKINKINPIDYFVFVTYFPKIIQGPITIYQDFEVELRKELRVDYDNLAKGLYLIASGFFKKILIADAFASFVNAGFSENYLYYNSTMSLFLVLAYTLQIYFDFSGYTDIARGVSFLFGIELPRNFDSPYKALSINDFWKRWHLSLTNFFTRYLYIPLGGNRKGEILTYRNIMIVFLISGLWHGANITFVVWGGIHGLISCIEKKFNYTEKLHTIARWTYTFMLVNALWLLFRSETIEQALIIFRNILSCDFSGIDFAYFSTLYLDEIWYIFNIFDIPALYRVYPLLLFIGCIISCIQFKNSDEITKDFRPSAFKAMLIIISLSWCLLHFGQKIVFIYEMF